MKSFKLLFIVAGVISFCFLFSCKKNKTQVVDFKYGYLPTDIGHYVIYDVDSITYNGFYNPVKVDTLHFYIKECIQSIFTDNTGQPTCWIEGYKSSTPIGPWSNYYTYTSNRTTTTAQETENNLRYTKLVFPPIPSTSWPGNSFIDGNTPGNSYLTGWIYSYRNVDVALQLTTSSGSLSFDSTLTIVQDSNVNLYNDTYSVEQYAKNAGLIYKELDVLALDSSNNNGLQWPQKANNGFIYKMTAIAYNK